MSVILSMFVFLAGFAKGPSLHYCYLSGNISAELHGMFTDAGEDACAEEKVKEDTCCSISSLSPLKGNCCEDFTLNVKVSEYSQNLSHYTPLNVFVAIFATTPYWFEFIIPFELIAESVSFALDDWEPSTNIPLFIKNSVFRI